MTETSRVDSKRRIVLPKDFIDEHGEEFIIIKVNGEIILKPLPKDPIALLKEEGKKLKGVSWQQIRREFEEELRKRT